MTEPTCIRFGPAVVRLESTTPEGKASISAISKSYGSSVDPKADVNATIQIVEKTARPSAPSDWARVTSYGPHVTVYSDGQAFCVHGQSVRSAVNAEGTIAEIRVQSGSLHDGEVDGHVLVCLTLILRRMALHPLHAACVSRGGDGVLIVGPSDVGKSTLAFNLVRAGWSFLSDDTVLLERRADGPIVAHSFRRRFALDADSSDLNPEIAEDAETIPGDESKWSVGVDTLYPSSFEPSVLPRLVIFPEIAAESTSHLTDISASDAFMRLAAQSALRELADSHTKAHHETMSELLAHCERRRLLAGGDIRNDPARASELLERALPASGRLP